MEWVALGLVLLFAIGLWFAATWWWDEPERQGEKLDRIRKFLRWW